MQETKAQCLIGALRDPEAAHYCGRSPDAWRKLRSLGRGPTVVRFGRSVRYLVSDLDAWLQSQRVESQVPSLGPHAPAAPDRSPSTANVKRRRGRPRSTGQLFLPSSSGGADVLLSCSMLGILGLEACALRAPDLMLCAVPLIAYVAAQLTRSQSYLRMPVRRQT